MARIPLVNSQLSARSGRTAQGVPSPMASADSFGGAQARALGSLAQGVDDAAVGVAAYQERKRNEDVANAVAGSDWTRRELELRNAAPADGAGFQDVALDEYDKFVEEQADAIEDDRTRKMFVERMRSQRPNVSSRSAQYEFTVAETNSKEKANASIIALDNKIRLQPDQYDDFVQQGFDVIDARPGITATEKASMKQAWQQGAALSRFEGLLDSATTIEDIRNVQAELRDEESGWSGQLTQQGLNRVIGLADAASKSIQTQSDSQARAAIDTLEGRASDVTSVIPQEELAAVGQLVENSQNPVTQARYARIVRDQQIIKESRKLTPQQQRQSISNAPANSGLPPRVDSAISFAAQATGISASYLVATTLREYGMYLKGDPESIDYGKGNAQGASSATGVMQFIDGTWGDVVKTAAFKAITGVDVTGMSATEVLELRKDPELSIIGGALLAKMNAAYLRKTTGREPTDAELYMAHFMGGPGASQLLRTLRDNPDANAAVLFPAQAEANPTIYYKKNGETRSVAEVYTELGRRHGAVSTSETYVAHGDRETRERLAAQTESRLADDPMYFAAQVGTATISDVFADGGMSARGEQARGVANYYSIPMEDMKPFTKDETTAMTKMFSDGSADDILSVITSVQQMGGDMARAAMKQIGDTNSVVALAGGLNLETAQAGTASDIIKGQKRIEENPDVRRQIGATEQDMAESFARLTGTALFDADPRQRQAIADAALAHYVETQVARGRVEGFNENAYASSIQAVMGASPGSEIVQDVNGAKTVLPAGVSGDEMETALESMSIADWTALSDSGEPPMYVDGSVVDPVDIADEVQLRAIGGNKYRVALSDGTYLVTGVAGGVMEAYIFAPKAEQIKAIAARGPERVEGGGGASGSWGTRPRREDREDPQIGFDFEAQKDAARAQGLRVQE